MTSDAAPVRREVVGEILVTTLDRTHVRNAVNMDMAVLLEQSIDLVEDDDELRAGVLCAEGPVFCAGADLRLLATGGPMPYTDRGGFAGIVRRLRTKPWVVAVEGPALAGGFEIVLACDVVIASVTAAFGLPEVRRGLFAGGGGLIRIGARLAGSAAMSLALTGDPISAARAHELGLVSELVPPGEALAAALTIARRIAANSPLSVEVSRRITSAGADMPIADAWAANDAAAERMLARADLGDGPQAFLDKVARR